MAELTLKRNEIEVLKVTIDDKNYSIPLGTSLRRKDLAKLKNEDEVMKFFENYLGKELMDDLTIGEIKTIITAWSEATEKQSGVKLGES
jgi:uncharacterized protein YqeY